MDSFSISLNKFISDTGYCSRREADNLIKAGRVFINDEVAQMGNRYDVGDVVEVDGSIIKPPKKDKLVYIALHKPAGITTTSEAHIPGNIIAFVKHPKRIFPIGRLDKDSEGLIFLTNDGDIVNKILRAGNKHEKEYEVRVGKPVAEGFVAKMSSGVAILDTVTAPCKVHMTGRSTFKITLTQGLNRQIRRMCEALGYNVLTLRRTRIMNISLGTLPLGKWRNLSDAEIAELKASVAYSDKTSTASPKAKKVKQAIVKPKAIAEPIETKAKVKAKEEILDPKKIKSGSYKDFRQKGRTR
ncbi:MAG: 23S rRNA pseudouridine(2604) synthase RluF [Phycisphaerales bacterium]|nr:23S rRNA pseudouridine(2604) synthase RluF [Phycisphaerales bacterium]